MGMVLVLVFGPFSPSPVSWGPPGISPQDTLRTSACLSVVAVLPSPPPASSGEEEDATEAFRTWSLFGTWNVSTCEVLGRDMEGAVGCRAAMIPAKRHRLLWGGCVYCYLEKPCVRVKDTRESAGELGCPRNAEQHHRAALFYCRISCEELETILYVP